jgi:5'-nucleotidase / UDP-sugar diphosphatase
MIKKIFSSRKLHNNLILFIALVLFSCNRDDNTISFTFLQLNDVYEIAPIQGGKFGGLARVETLHKQLLDENENSFLFMAGDFLNPSLIGSLKVNGERIRGKQMVEVMNAMNFDLVAFGNHEFDLPYKDLQKRLNESNFPWIGGNVYFNDKNNVPFYKKVNNKKEHIPETYIKEISDTDGTSLKVGFVSVCIPSNPKDYVVYDNMFKKIRTSYAAIKDSVDVVFGLTHVKVTHDKRIAKLLPNIPLIMGGHDHTNMLIKTAGGIITKADANAKTVYIHRIIYNKETKEISINSELKEINTTIKPDKNVSLIIDKWQSILNSEISNVISNPNEVIYTSNEYLDGRDKPIRSKQTNLGKLITKSMALAFDENIDCSLVNGGSIRIDDQLYGDITPMDIFRVLPFGGAVLRVKIKGRLLKRVLDYGEMASGTGAYLQRYNIHKSKSVWFVNEQKLLEDKIYSVAFSDYLLKGFDIPFLSEENEEVYSIYYPLEDEIANDIRKTVVAYLKTN